ncbi:hypothetical protein [Mucilaginibacter lappiensis]|uniref:Uncharacterized protein n=1 Tax=Mucilaginibacter lappiensis TaxID=354630 RepID=A0A841JET9_9SPHI|nr:hypothetical protein [Mucilaginibacter lappiensis]MBB6109710.1 hypothetical protein [Mucilaginibacter lappiensis]MBB6126965.1 hypothetical protein [Mucilaginibacter lappiensis]
MKYFHQTEWDIKWKMTWENYMLYISSIPRYDSEEAAKPKLEVKDASELF